MRIQNMFRSIKSRFLETVGSVTQEYVMTTAVSLGIVALIVKFVQSDFFLKIVEGLVSGAYATLSTGMLKFFG